MTGQCVCHKCFGGAACDVQIMGEKNCGTPQKLCPKWCSGHGYCDHTTGKCECTKGFLGKDCANNACPNSCSGHGKCDGARKTCTCDKKWYGKDCSKATCPFNCHQTNGECMVQLGRCACIRGYTG